MPFRWLAVQIRNRFVGSRAAWVFLLAAFRRQPEYRRTIVTPSFERALGIHDEGGRSAGRRDNIFNPARPGVLEGPRPPDVPRIIVGNCERRSTGTELTTHPSTEHHT